MCTSACSDELHDTGAYRSLQAAESRDVCLSPATVHGCAALLLLLLWRSARRHNPQHAGCAQIAPRQRVDEQCARGSAPRLHACPTAHWLRAYSAAAARAYEQRVRRQRAWVGTTVAHHQHTRRRRARDSIGSVTMPSARSVSAVAMNSMRLISGRVELEAYRDGLRWDHAVYHACEGQGSHGTRDDARWARGFQVSSGCTRDAGTHSG